MEYLVHERNHERVQIPKWNRHLKPDQLSISLNQIIPDEQIEWSNDYIFKPGYLASIQAAELKELEESPERLAELETDLKTFSDKIDTNYELHVKPELFPEELWKFWCFYMDYAVIYVIDEFGFGDVLECFEGDFGIKTR